jgi:hypothetical protein
VLLFLTFLGVPFARVVEAFRDGRFLATVVVLPLALALPPTLALTPLVVVTQTLVELIVMVALVAGTARPPMPRR